ncbi:hypothetical protein Brsp07_03314 [Brucella sp. NBRC 14130]
MPRLETFERSGNPVECVLQCGEQRFPFAGQHQPARQALEQRHIQPGLKAFDLMADSGLRDAKLDRGLGEAEVARRRFEGAQRIEREMRTNHEDPNFSNVKC